ncbi:MAG: ABC transporter permease [Candidatus Eisenbacteria bacterium]|nr:ABC transporter permease [Candidatus Eisenbacteria bacterium]
MGPLLCIVRKELIQLRRDKALLRLVLAVPMLQLLIFAYAINNDLKNVRVSVLDEDRTPLTRRLAEALYQADAFVPGPAPAGEADAAELLRRSETDLMVHVPRGFTRAVLRGESPQVGVVVDGTNSSTAGRAAGYTEAVLTREAVRLFRAEAGARAAAQTGRISTTTRFLFNPELESRIYMVPGIIVMLVTIISVFVTGMAVVREKEIGTLEQVRVTPLSTTAYLIGKTLPFAAIALVDLVLATAFAMAWFGVPMVGSPLTLLAGVLAYLTVTLGLGLLASAASGTQQQAMFTIWFFLIFAVLLSGFFVPVQNMPSWARALTWLNPMRFFMNVVRGVLLRGAGFADLRTEFLMLLGMGALAYGSAALRFGREGE